MSLTLFLVVAAGGLAGAPTRYLLDRAISGRSESDLPWGTFAINISGAFLFGLLSGLALAHHLSAAPVALLGTGFCGAFTTFSTFSFETVRLLEDGRLLEGFINLAGTVLIGLLAAAAGVAIGLAT